MKKESIYIRLPKTGCDSRLCHILQRLGWIVCPADREGSDDAAQARWFPIDSIPSLAFDHEKILPLALGKIKKGKV